IQIWLMAEKAMPVVLLRNRIPGPVRKFGIEKNDAGALVFGVGVAPHVPVTTGIVARAAGFLKPWMLIGGVVQHHLDGQANVTLVGGVEKCFEVVERSVGWVYGTIVRDVVAIIPKR